MALLTASEMIVILTTAIIVGLVIFFHYEVIHQLHHWCRKRGRAELRTIRHRPTILVVMFALLFAHIAEIWLFGATYWLLLGLDGHGEITGYSTVGLMDCIYFSAANYTTVGWGDLNASGDIRFLAGTEALVGFMMITWSASFGYLVMARSWPQE